MDFSSYIPDRVWLFCREWKRELIRYGFAFTFFFIALGTSRWALAAAIMPSIGIMMVYDRWGRPWQKRGESMLKPKKP
ncbi:MAG: hypothetical protein ABL974_15605 [Prosthecobacter sp.]